jgi:hypothetical protein
MAKTKRGKVIVIATQKSMTDVKMKKTYYTDYTLAKAASVKDGVVISYRLPNSDKRYELARGFQTAMVITDEVLQDAAQRLFERAEQGGVHIFENMEGARNAIKAFL